MVLKVSINKTELLILPVSTQLGSVSLSHSGLFFPLHSVYNSSPIQNHQREWETFF